MAAMHGNSGPKLRSSWLIPGLAMITIMLMIKNFGVQRMPQIPSFVMVDTLSESNWTQVEVSKLSLPRVHHGGLLHHKVWILPFDEMWHIGLQQRSEHDSCSGSFGPVESHVTSGATVASAVSEMAGRLRRNRKVAPLVPLGRPFLLENGGDREIVHIFALVVQGVFPTRGRKWFNRVMKPVKFVQDAQSVGIDGGAYCSKERAEWMARAVSYAMRRFKLKEFKPKSNPMDEADAEEAICCKNSVDMSEDLEECGLNCNSPDMFNIISMFPSGRR